MAQPLTDDEKTTLKNAAYGAILLVSDADPGLLAMVKESVAASRALAGSGGAVRDALAGGDVPDLPRAPAAEIEARVLPELTRSMAILAAKAPDEVSAFRDTVLAACQQAARAAGGVKDAERAEIAKIRAALAER